MALTNPIFGSSFDPGFDTFRSNFDRLFDDFSRGVMNPAAGGDLVSDQDWGQFPRRRFGRGRRLLCMNMKDMDAAYEIRLEAPGVPKEDVVLTVDDSDNSITVEINRAVDDKGQFLFRECPSGRLHRVIVVPNDGDVDKANVSYHNGELRMSVPKKKHGEGKRLTIE